MDAGSQVRKRDRKHDVVGPQACVESIDVGNPSGVGKRGGVDQDDDRDSLGIPKVLVGHGGAPDPNGDPQPVRSEVVGVLEEVSEESLPVAVPRGEIAMRHTVHCEGRLYP